MDSLTPHLPVLQIIVPLIIAPLILLLRSRHAAWLLATVAALFCPVQLNEMLATVQARGAIDYRLGNWPDYVGDCLSD